MCSYCPGPGTNFFSSTCSIFLPFSRDGREKLGDMTLGMLLNMNVPFLLKLFLGSYVPGPGTNLWDVNRTTRLIFSKLTYVDWLYGLWLWPWQLFLQVSVLLSTNQVLECSYPWLDYSSNKPTHHQSWSLSYPWIRLSSDSKRKRFSSLIKATFDIINIRRWTFILLGRWMACPVAKRCGSFALEVWDVISDH